MKIQTVLQVEDDSNDVFLLKVAFEQARIVNPIQTVSSGEEAIAYLSGRGQYRDRAIYPLPGLILLDLHTPKLTGLDVLAWVANEPDLNRIPIVVLSSSNLSCDIWQCYELGANAYVAKPFSNSERLRLARAIKDFWLDFNLISSECSVAVSLTS